ncbi:hypothetical protein GDO81_022487 [Engystomops pustulosus]|uniref:G-protein coupled receptors family 1 profile domain-containing protein n=1 Tax=Engystomops pustulosus TaxID=76066 RepID=A0AAV6YX18_ENGPU|nr:hypothetical protein GDO81_022487 [Engystomops pustulosus]
MENITFSSSVLMLNFGELTSIKYLYCVFVLFGYILIVLLNGVVVIAVVQHKSLHEPMYIFISVLCVNGVYGSSAFYPSLLIHLLQKKPSIFYFACLTQVFCLHSYCAYEMTILASMAYDRYVSICNPLRYNRIMTPSTVVKVVIGAWLYPTPLLVILIILTIELPLCGNNILKFYCDNWSVVKLSCVDTSVNNIYGLLLVVVIIGSTAMLIFYSYFRILIVCMRSSKNVQEKALQTCTPHLITIANFLVDTLFEILLHRFTATRMPEELRIIMSLQFVVVPPILNPFIYGLKMKKIKSKVKELLSGKSKKETVLIVVR